VLLLQAQFILGKIDKEFVFFKGRSHSAAEYTMPEDAASGATVLATALYRLAY
jgi:acetylornithine deacetylase/succinyl-diaminopimelate desuccinylase-like protein